MTTLIKNKIDIPQVPTKSAFDKFVNTWQFARDPFIYMQKLQKNYGDIVRLKGAIMDFTFVFSPEYTRQVLTDTALFHNGEAKDLLVRVPEDSAIRRLLKTLNTINGDTHKQQRRMMMPAFHRKRVESYRNDMVELTERRLQNWQTGQTLNILREMKELTLAIAVKTLLGLDPAQEGQQTRLLVERWTTVGATIPALLLPYNLPGLPFRTMMQLSEQIETLFKQMIERKRAVGTDSGDVLSMLMQMHDEDGTRLSDEELIAETLTLFVAGHETTATALTWTLFLLSQHPRIMADLLDELDSKLQGDAPTVEQLNDLPLLEYVIKESMRILSPFLFGFRITTEPTEMGDYYLPKGTRVAFAPSVIQHRPDIYEQPNRFWPERWRTIDPSPYEYLPFSSGPRMCIGATFATMEMKIVLATLLQRYRLTLVPNARIDRTGFLLTYPKQGMPMQIYSQDRRFSRNAPRGNIHQVVQL